MHAKLNVGDKAPNFKFETPWERGSGFYKAAGENPAVLVFLRYHGCPVCQMEMAKLKRDIDLIKKKGARVFVILQSSPATVAAITNEKVWPFTIVCDPQGDVFQLYDVKPGGVIKYLHPAGLIAAIKATLQGFKHGKFEGKETQLPAAFVVAADKVIKYAHYGKNISDVPSPATLAANIE